MRGVSAFFCCVLLFWAAATVTPAAGEPLSPEGVDAGNATDGAAAIVQARLDALVAAYPDHLQGHDGEHLIWQDGTRMIAVAAEAQPSPDVDLDDPAIVDMFYWNYPAGAPLAPPLAGADPGRIRHQAFFRRMYGDCHAGEVAPRLRRVDWLPEQLGLEVTITSVNGIDRALTRVSRELDQLDSQYMKYLENPGGTYVCRNIAGTERMSVHAFGAAIDINVAQGAYWRWVEPDEAGGRAWRNRVPRAIVDIFERHGFIWGGRWHHFDTMHFEYRPELIGYRE